MKIDLKKVNFSESSFAKGNRFEWKFGLHNAKEILYYAPGYTSIFDLLCDIESLTDELNFHSSLEGSVDVDLNDNVDQEFEKLEISNWSYQEIIGSCIFYVLKDKIINSVFGKKTIGGLCYVIKNLTSLVATKHLQSIFLFVLKDTHLFECAPIECCKGFKIYFTHTKSFNHKFIDVMTKDRLKSNLESLKQFLYFLGASENKIEEIINECIKNDNFQSICHYIESKINFYEKYTR